MLAGRTDLEAEAQIPWPPHEKRRLPGKDPDVGKDGGHKEKGPTEDEMVGQCSRNYQHVSDQTAGGSGRQECLACSGPWGHKESDTTKRLNNNNNSP